MTGLPEYLGITTVDVGPGTMTAELEVRTELLNPFGTAHGRVLTALVDHVLGSVLYPLIPRGAWAATTEFKVNLLAPVRDGVLRARSEVLALTKRTAVVRIDVTNDDRLVGLAQGTVPGPGASSSRSPGAPRWYGSTSRTPTASSVWPRGP